MRNSNRAYCDSLANKKPKMTLPAHISHAGCRPAWLQTRIEYAWAGCCYLKKSKMPVDSTVTLIAKLRGLSTAVPPAKAVWYASNCRALSVLSIATYGLGEPYHAAQYACGYWRPTYCGLRSCLKSSGYLSGQTDPRYGSMKSVPYANVGEKIEKKLHARCTVFTCLDCL